MSISESRVAGPKMNEMRLQGLFLRVSRDLLSSTLIANGTNYTTSSLIHTAELRNLDTGAAFYFSRHDQSTSTALTTTQLTVTTSAGTILIPSTGSLTFNGRDSKIIVTDYVFGQNNFKMLYSTAEVMTWTTIGSTDVIILYAPSGQSGETAIQLTNPVLDLSSFPNISSKFSNGLLTLNYITGGSQLVQIQNGNTNLAVFIMDKATANTWHAPVLTQSGTFGNYFSIGSNATVLVGGPYLVRSAAVINDTLALAGDLNGTTTIKAIVPPNVEKITWNSQLLTSSKNSSGLISAIAQSSFPSPAIPPLPTLTRWKVSGSLPEISPDFDDSGFATGSQTTTNYTNLPVLAGDKVLYSQQYGFYGGNLIFRGHFNATGQETAIQTTVQFGFAGGYSAWLNGVFLGSSQGNSTVSFTTDTWKGGAANTPDTFRGYLNEGGLYAERVGAHLPDFPDASWADGTPLTGGGVKGAGVNFFRTTFDLRVPAGIDMPVRLSITPSAITSNFRAQIYLNGWQIGKYINNIGPQTLFVLPAGILRRNSTNTLALSLWSLDGGGASLAGLNLVSDGTFETSFQFNDYVTPDYADQAHLRPAAIFDAPM
uniref:Beta-galactosidase domain-containing protein n=1 Tax=Psilocybe cubensis TaxID=181762 RepID=A0A8H7XSU3_PSICU